MALSAQISYCTFEKYVNFKSEIHNKIDNVENIYTKPL